PHADDPDQESGVLAMRPDLRNRAARAHGLRLRQQGRAPPVGPRREDCPRGRLPLPRRGMGAEVSFEYTPHPAGRRDQAWQRALSVFPAAVSWTLLGGLTIASVAFPTASAALLIALLLYFVIRIVHNSLFLALSFLRVRAEEKSDWLA